MITRISGVVLYVADQQRSLDFYVGTLGFTEHANAEMAPGKRWIEVVPTGAQTTLILTAAADFDREPGSSVPPTLRCDDAHRTYERLKAAGVDVDAPVSEPWSTYIRFRDPDGHDFVVGEEREPQQA